MCQGLISVWSTNPTVLIHLLSLSFGVWHTQFAPTNGRLISGSSTVSYSNISHTWIQSLLSQTQATRLILWLLSISGLAGDLFKHIIACETITNIKSSYSYVSFIILALILYMTRVAITDDAGESFYYNRMLSTMRILNKRCHCDHNHISSWLLGIKINCNDTSAS